MKENIIIITTTITNTVTVRNTPSQKNAKSITTKMAIQKSPTTSITTTIAPTTSSFHQLNYQYNSHIPPSLTLPPPIMNPKNHHHLISSIQSQTETPPISHHDHAS
ncbi:unnamed protein product [Ilex paraguariensis]|uniref:Uncharacterized protein n=1 Tax=Ilex paraguariensis TaxID=185542 RepID=A0ABC8QUK5_9AQUA